MRVWSHGASRAVTAALFATLAGAVYLGLFALIQAATGPATAWISALLAATVLTAVLGFLEPARRHVERLLDATLSAEHVRARDHIHRAVRELARVREEAAVAACVSEALRDGMDVADVQLVAGRCDETAPGSLVVPFPPRPGLSGALVLSPRRGVPYSRDERALVETLAVQAAVAITNARAWEEIDTLERRAREENAYLREAVLPAADAGELVGRSLVIRSVLAQVRQVAPTDSAVLVLGETGTGKELVVREIHRQSRRADRILVQVASAAVPEALLESELFGHERGAFTGADTRRLGRFELADGGTLFLDDVDTLPPGIQAKLLRALQEGEVQPLGSTRVRLVDVRIVAASNRDLLAEVQAGRFREDLYYRLHVVPIRLPALRDRREDIPLLVDHFVRRESARLGRPIGEVPGETLLALQRHDWPGNVRELRNLIERAIVMSPDGVLRLPEAPAPRPAVAGTGAYATELGTASLAELMQRYKVRLIRAALAQSGGNQRRAAEVLGIHRPSLTRMLRDVER